MKITILGSGAAIPDGEGVQSGYLLKKDDNVPLLIDSGSGIVHRLGQTSSSILDIETVLITHPHPDHVTDLISLVQARRLMNKSKLKIFGPEKTRETVRNLLEAVDLWDRVSVEVIHLENNSVREIDNYKVETLRTKHSIPSFAYKIDDKLVYTGDTEKFDELREFVKNVEIIIHDASYPTGSDMKNHVTPEDIGEIVQDSNAKMLLLSHLYPQAREDMDSTLDYLEDKFSGSITPASDLETFKI